MAGEDPSWIEALQESEEVSQLVYALTLADRFYFAAIVCDDPPVVDTVLDALVDRVSEARGTPIRLVRLDPYGGYDRSSGPIPFERVVDKVLARLTAPAPSERSPEVVFVIDASRALSEDYAWEAMFQRMNERRNTLVKALGRPLLLCVPSWLERVFAQRAPDFWSIVSLAVAIKARAPAEEPAKPRRRRGGFESAPVPPAQAPIQGLSPEDLRTVHAAALRLGLSRDALLAGLDRSYVGTLPRATSASEQILVDLVDMNQTGTLSDRNVPLARWLQNAAALAGYRHEKALFERCLASLSSSSISSHPRVSIGRLSATAKRLFGRDDELAWLDTCWNNGTRVASIIAFGGVGKTALVNAWLASMNEAGWRGATNVYVWSFARQGTDLQSSDEFLAAAMKWFGEPDMGSAPAWDKGDRLAKVVGRERAILVLDGVEPLQWGPGVQEGRFKDQGLEALLKGLGAANEGMCLVTTRIRLTDMQGAGGDKVVSRDLRQLSPEAGAELLLSRGAVGTQAELIETAREYKGHSLALTLLGSYLAVVAKGDIRRRNEIGPVVEEDTRLGGHARRVLERYESWLGKAEVNVLHMIGLFDGPADEGEIGALRAEPAVVGLNDALVGVGANEWNKIIARLRRIGLLLDEPDRRLDAHPLVREHFGEAFRKENLDSWREGHRRLYEHLRSTAKELPETVEEMGPLYAAVVHGCRAGRHQEALDDVYWTRIERGEEYFNWKKLGAFGAQVAVLSAFFDPPWERLAPGLAEPDQAYILNEAGIALRALGRLPDAAGLMRLGLDKRIAQEDWTNAAVQAGNLSELWQTRGELREALSFAEQSVALADKSGDTFERMTDRSVLADVQHQQGRTAEATALFEEVERLQKELEPACPWLYSLRGFKYCDVLLEQGQEAKVLARATQTLEWARTHVGLLDIALDHLSLGRAHLRLVQRSAGADLNEAASHLQQAVEGLRRAGQQDHLPLGLLARAELHLAQGDLHRAQTDLAESLALSTRSGFRLHEADTHLAYVRLYLAEGHPDQARAHLDRARKLIAETEYHRRDAELADLTRALTLESPAEASKKR